MKRLIAILPLAALVLLLGMTPASSGRIFHVEKQIDTMWGSRDDSIRIASTCIPVGEERMEISEKSLERIARSVARCVGADPDSIYLESITVE